MTLTFQSLSGNSSVVGFQTSEPERQGNTGFNPFQGIQVLSGNRWCSVFRKKCSVSIPFREFKCCRPSTCDAASAKAQVSIPFREFKCCRGLPLPGTVLLSRRFNPFQGIQVLSVSADANFPIVLALFQSLSGNSSVVGSLNVYEEDGADRFQSLSGNSSVVGWDTPQPAEKASLFQSLSGNSSVVGKFFCYFFLLYKHRFNPFQGIQVLSGV